MAAAMLCTVSGTFSMILFDDLLTMLEGMCGEFFCYLCVTPYSVINQSGHGNGCAYAGANRFDPHAAALAPGGIAGLA